MPSQVVPLFVREELRQLGVTVSDAVLARLADYLHFLLETNEKFNLTGIREPDAAWRRHIVDSLTLIPFLDASPELENLVDVGSGAGLPGLPISVVRPDLDVTLIEATGKKARFIEDAAARMELKRITVLNRRAELAGQDPAHRERYQMVVCRALGPMRELLEYTLPLLKRGGRLLAMKGPSAEAELEACGDALQLLGAGDLAVYDAYPEGFDQQTVVVVVDKASATPKSLPRKPGMPRQTPL